MRKNNVGFATRAVHEGEGQFYHHPSSTPIFQTSTFYFDTIEEAGRVSQGTQKGFVYTRIGNRDLAGCCRLPLAAEMPAKGF